MSADLPIYSLCICNYNMADTLNASLSSIMDQLDERFEVVVVDDGSTDDSVAVLVDLQKQYSMLRVFPVKKERRRRLGLTRNESIRLARGRYVLLHIDCDDIYAPHLIDFTQVFHMVEEAAGRDILLSGHHVNMGRRDFLLAHGPYRNIFRGEDRDMWLRLAAIGAYIPLDHIDFVQRLPKTQKARLTRSIMYTYDHLLNDFRAKYGFPGFFRYEFHKWPGMNMRQKLFRVLCYVPAWIQAQFEEPLPQPESMKKPEIFMEYRNRVRGKLADILGRYGQVPDWTRISPAGKAIFD